MSPSSKKRSKKADGFIRIFPRTVLNQASAALRLRRRDAIAAMIVPICFVIADWIIDSGGLPEEVRSD